jgi:hypothetical protein
MRSPGDNLKDLAVVIVDPRRRSARVADVDGTHFLEAHDVFEDDVPRARLSVEEVRSDVRRQWRDSGVVASSSGSGLGLVR